MGISYMTGLFELLIIGRLLIGINAGKNDRNDKKKCPHESDFVKAPVKSERCEVIWKCSHFSGIGLCVQPMYLIEIAPTVLRGTMGMGTSIFITTGILIGQVVGLQYARGRIFRQYPNFSWATKLWYDLTESSWGERSCGPFCCPLHVSPHSCSWSPCPVSPRVHATCSSTEETRRELKKVTCKHWPVWLIDSLDESIVLKAAASFCHLKWLSLEVLVGRACDTAPFSSN